MLDFKILTIYRAPLGNFDTSLDSLNIILSDICAGTRTVLAGNFNINFNSNELKLQ